MGYVTSVELFMDLKPQIYEVWVTGLTFLEGQRLKTGLGLSFRNWVQPITIVLHIL